MLVYKAGESSQRHLKMPNAISPALKRFRMILWGLVVVAAIGATVLFIMRPPAAPGISTPGGSEALAVTGRPFTMQSTQGGSFTQDNLKGTPSLVFFGYTNCPDVCPTTLAESTVWKEQAGVSDADLRTIFVTVDPARDDLDTVKAYLEGFDPDVVGLVGTEAETEATKAAFGAMSETGEKREDGFYLVNHTASVFLLNRNGSFEGTIAYGEPQATAVEKVKKLLSK
jgi:protein SCO1/2